MYRILAVEQTFHHGGGVLDANTLHEGIGHDGCRVVADHTAAMSGARPFGEESALLVDIDKALHHLPAFIGIYQVEQGEEAAEGVPEACAGVEVAFAHLAVVGRAVYDVARSIFLPVFHGEEQRAVKAGIEGAGFGGAEVYEFAVDGNASERLVPDAVSLGLHSVEGVAGHLALKVKLGLFRTDVRRCHTGVDLLAAARFETNHGKGMETFRLQSAVLRHLVGVFTFFDGGAEIGVGIFEGLVKLDDEILAESLLYASGVAGGIAADDAAFGNDFHH